MSLERGQLLDGKFRVAERLAEGGMGEVWRGTNERLGKPVAIKILRSDMATDLANVARFEREARVSAKIASSHVADVYDFGELESGERFMVMEYLEGETLAARLERERTLTPEALAEIALQILDALAAAHAAGVVHRDLKPENVILTAGDGRDRASFVKLVDFGVSKLVGDVGLRIDERATACGALLGTPVYMSPEQARGSSKAVDHRTDLWALGVILYEATSGELPFVGENINELLFSIALDTPRPLEAWVPSIHPQLAAAVKRALEKDPRDRFPDAEAMRDALLAWREALVPRAPREEATSLQGVVVANSAPRSLAELVERAPHSLRSFAAFAERARADRRAARVFPLVAAIALMTASALTRPPPPAAASEGAPPPAATTIMELPDEPPIQLAPPPIHAVARDEMPAPSPAPPAPAPARRPILTAIAKAVASTAPAPHEEPPAPTTAEPVVNVAGRRLRTDL